MTLLIRAPETVASWSWEIESEEEDNLSNAVRYAVSASGVLARQRILNPSKVKISWHEPQRGSIGVDSIVHIEGGANMAQEELLRKIREIQPKGRPESYSGALELLGPGVWIDSQGNERPDQDLIGISFFVDHFGVAVDLWVTHDIWAWYDFFGTPHPGIYQNNAPRLASVIKDLEEILNAEVEPGEATYFAEPEKYGIRTPGPSSKMAGFDASLRL